MPMRKAKKEWNTIAMVSVRRQSRAITFQRERKKTENSNWNFDCPFFIGAELWIKKKFHIREWECIISQCNNQFNIFQ